MNLEYWVSQINFTAFVYFVEDEMYKSMRRNVVVLIAVLLGLQPKSNNLWFHLFEPLELMNTFIPGFLVRYLFGSIILCYI